MAYRRRRVVRGRRHRGGSIAGHSLSKLGLVDSFLRKHKPISRANRSGLTHQVAQFAGRHLGDAGKHLVHSLAKAGVKRGYGRRRRPAAPRRAYIVKGSSPYRHSVRMGMGSRRRHRGGSWGSFVRGVGNFARGAYKVLRPVHDVVKNAKLISTGLTAASARYPGLAPVAQAAQTLGYGGRRRRHAGAGRGRFVATRIYT